MKKISLAVSSLLLTSSLFADNSLSDAIKGGTVSGDVTLYGERQNNSGVNADSGFTMGSIQLSYETAEYNGFKAAVGFRGNHDFSEVEDGDYSDGSESKAIMHTANASYTNKYFGLTLGRQEIDLEWMGDFHEAAVLAVSAIPDTTLVFGYSQRIAVADEDAVLEDFADLANGAFVIDAKYEGIENLVLNPYFYNVDIDTGDASWYGLKVNYDTDVFGITLHGAKSSEDAIDVEDGKIYHIEGRTSLAGFGLMAGYVKTGDDGIGSMDAAGDNINPFDAIAGGDGNQVYSQDARTAYLGATYTIADIDLTAVYGQTKYEFDDKKENEFDFSAEYAITEELAIAATYINVDADSSIDDYDKVSLTLQYSF
ncbi:Opr family porin [Halarcobacter sp.]|uniref:Opr family porin n=1 Tax=Halarcobacter sp. TaxID=2321133 RepID=UPI0029F48116|nr:Opr family porin [Halarcobacter sp.]